MNAKQVLDLINEVEERFPVDEWVIDSVHVWPLIRIQIFFDMRDILIGARNEHPKGPALLRNIGFGWRSIVSFARYVRASLADSEHNAKPGKADVIFLGDQLSRIMLNGAWYDRLCDPVAEYLQGRGMIWFHLDPHHDYRIPRCGASLFVQPSLDWARIKGVLFRGRMRRSAEQLDGFEEFVRYLEAWDLRATLADLGQLRTRVMFIRAMADHFRKILEEVKPRIGFVVEYYGHIGMAFNLACHEHGIKTVEIPHGNHGDIHVAYSRWNRIPQTGYALLPSIFWCWTDREAAQIARWSAASTDEHRPFVGGNLWLELWRKGDSGIVREYDTRIRAIKDLHPDAKHILITYEHDVPAMFELMKYAPCTWHWWIRLHPTRLDEKGKVRRLARDCGIANCEVETATDLPLYALLRHMDAHVTECSSVVIEAEAFGVPSVITRDYGVEAFPEQIRSGWSRPAYSRDDIIAMLSSQMEGKKGLPPVIPCMTKGGGHPLDSLLESVLSTATK